MFKPWICLLVLGVAVYTVTAQDYWDSYEEFWSKEALDQDLGVADDNNKQDGDIVSADEEINGFDEPESAAKAVDPELEAAVDEDGNDVPLDNVADDNNANDDTQDEDVIKSNVPSDDTKENDQAVQEEIEQFRRELDQPEDDSVDLDDYQFEDNRSDVKEALPGLPAADVDQIVEDAQKLLAEEDSPFERDMEEIEPQNADEETLVETNNDSGNENELGDDSLDDTVQDKQNEVIDNFLDEAKNNDENEDAPEENVGADEPPVQDDMVDDKADELKDISEEEDNILNFDVLASKNVNDVADKIDDEMLEENDDEMLDDNADDDTYVPLENNDKAPSDDLRFWVPEEEDDQVVEDKDTVHKEFEERQADLVKPFKTWDKLQDDPEEDEQVAENNDNVFNDHVLGGENEDIVAEKSDDELREDNDDDDMNFPLENNDKAPEDDQVAEDEDTVDKVYADLHADLAKLFETMDKLQDDPEDDTDVLEYEEKFGKPFREDVVLSQRDDYDNYDDNANDVDSNLDDIFADKSDAEDEEDAKVDDPLDKLLETQNDEKEISYDNDAFVADAPEKKNEEIVEHPVEVLESVEEEAVESAPTTIAYVSSKEYDQMMADFAKDKADELDTQREGFGKNIAAVHLTLSADEAIEVTSPNYPNAYPTNNVVDWVLEGNGSGIELNITDLAVRGAQNDYLLIKPGGVDNTGTDGLVFSFYLNEPRSYRWTEVDRVFVRFVSGTGLNFQRGFHMSVKMIWPPQIIEDEPVPEPEPQLPPLPATYTVNLGGVTVKEFSDLEEQFLHIVADMATVYINNNGLEPGLNNTRDVAQITSTRHCNINWVNFVGCVEVTFGVPLVFEETDSNRLDEEDLRAMWETYVDQDPFAQRLSSLGISMFPVPNDGRILMAWMVLGVGVIVSAAVLAFALWRYSCADNYTRMKSFSDTDSVRNEKRGLDLYPTPHQTLPPLYADQDYKWADDKYDDSTRVDMGGFTNRSYVRDELFDIDSDEDVATPRNGNAGIAPRDIYNV